MREFTRLITLYIGGDEDLLDEFACLVAAVRDSDDEFDGDDEIFRVERFARSWLWDRLMDETKEGSLWRDITGLVYDTCIDFEEIAKWAIKICDDENAL